jgi:hypothetical protein
LFVFGHNGGLLARGDVSSPSSRGIVGNPGGVLFQFLNFSDDCFLASRVAARAAFRRFDSITFSAVLSSDLAALTDSDSSRAWSSSPLHQGEGAGGNSGALAFPGLQGADEIEVQGLSIPGLHFDHELPGNGCCDHSQDVGYGKLLGDLD